MKFTMKQFNIYIQIFTGLQTRINLFINFYNTPELVRAHLFK